MKRFLLLLYAAPILAASPSHVSAVGFVFDTIDAAGDAGYHNSMIVDGSGNEHVAYFDFFMADLKYAKRTGGVWALQTLDTPDNVGQSPSIALDSFDNPGIAYLVITQNPMFDSYLRYAKFNGVSWSYTTFDVANNTGGWPSLQFDSSDYPHICHYDMTSRDLLYQYFDGVSWIVESVDTTGWVGSATSMALNASDEPHISYYDQTNLDLKYAFKSGGNWTVERVDSITAVGGASSLVLDAAGVPHIAYYEETTGSLKYAVRTGGVWSSDYVLITGNNGIAPSLQLDSDEDPHISCHENIDDDLWYAVWDNGEWKTAKLDSINHKGSDNSLQIKANDLPVISYFDFTTGALLFAEGVHPLRVPEHYPTIQQALNAAWDGDSVHVSSGTHSGPNNRNLNPAGKDLFVYSGDGPLAATIDGSGAGKGFIFGSGETTNFVLDGFRFQATTDAAIDCFNGSSPTIRNCEVGFVTLGRGIRLNQSSALIEDCDISFLTSFYDGIAIHVQQGSPTIRGCQFTTNMDDASFIVRGGALWLESTDALVEDCYFGGNQSGDEGGAIYIVGSPGPSIVDCTFEGNRAGFPGNRNDGGAIFCANAPALISGCTFRGNVADDGGAIAMSNFSAGLLHLTIDASFIAANSAEGAGGGLWIRGYRSDIISSTIAQNSAGTLGGGIHFVDKDSAFVEKTILWDNCATTSGDDAYFDENAGTNDVFVDFQCCDLDVTMFSGPGSWSLVADNITQDPMFLDPGICGSLIGNDYGVDCDSPCQPQNSPCGERIGAEGNSCVVAVIDEGGALPRLAAHAIPNPFAGATHIHYTVPAAGEIDLRVYDLRGRLVRVLQSGRVEPGPALLEWDGLDGDGRRVAPGVYFVRLRLEQQEAIARTVLLQH